LSHIFIFSLDTLTAKSRKVNPLDVEIHNGKILNVILSRRTVHKYKDAVVPAEILKEALRAASYAPNHKLTWPWRFYSLGFKSRQQLAEALPKLKSRLLFSGECIAVGILKSEDPIRRQEDYATLAAALQNMALYLWSEGYGSKWSTGSLVQTPTLQNIVSANTSENVEVCGLFWIGIPEEVPEVARRPELDTFFTVIE